MRFGIPPRGKVFRFFLRVDEKITALKYCNHHMWDWGRKLSRNRIWFPSSRLLFGVRFWNYDGVACYRIFTRAKVLISAVDINPWLAKYYYCSALNIYKSMLPQNINLTSIKRNFKLNAIIIIPKRENSYFRSTVCESIRYRTWVPKSNESATKGKQLKKFSNSIQVLNRLLLHCFLRFLHEKEVHKIECDHMSNIEFPFSFSWLFGKR